MDNLINYKEGEENNLDVKQEVFRYLRYWPWFALALVIALISAFTYLRYSHRIYETSSKIKILDESEGLELPSSAFVFNRSNINLENESEILTSYLIIDRVVRELNLSTRFYEDGTVVTSQIDNLPLDFHQIIEPDSIEESSSYKINVKSKGFEVINLGTEELLTFSEFSTFNTEHHLPFNIRSLTADYTQLIIGKSYIVQFIPVKSATLDLKSKINIGAIGEQSDLLKLSIKGESKVLSESILNTLMDVFDKDGISDRQLVSKRTLDFIDGRFVFLAEELDSIEVDRQDFKQRNNLVDITVDAELGLEQRTKSEQEVFQIESQLELSRLLETSLNENSESDLLPSNIGVDNSSINILIAEYNNAVINRDKILNSGGVNNPLVKQAVSQVESLKANINRSLKSYVSQLEASSQKLNIRNQRFIGKVSQIPQKEKLLRAINRQQHIKESLYLLLLQKREEAAINLAITEPSIKVVEYALSGSIPISPKSKVIYAVAILGGLLIPFGLLYLVFMLDTKLHGKEDIIKINSKTPIIGEIPDVKTKEEDIFDDPNARTALAESFRILSSNVDFILPVRDDGKAKVIYCTSTIKGEGKTFISLNLSLALSSINKKVLLIGADLRNPQIHNRINEDKHKPGLSNYLHDGNYDWRDSLIKGFEKHPNHSIMLSGSIPPNPAQLLTNGRFTKLIEEAKEEFDYIIVDTAPTILVTDTMLISQLADATVYLARANYTDKNLLKYSKDLAETGKLKNMAYVINSVGASKSYGYGYNYGYNYGYGNQK
ncbi:GumC family protein [Winogradskyella psychrotolerans]|uniref:GumC family protein n=1 Tax=Winogradskyella psychrotolerans TaxID=1344585 RepID=UPI001C06DE21|nr:tyrosine-protein kinase domain-containing protein [Winogradskyella psychrotolerans]MBU2927571.1 polysaccharide biosynthesis tyrosine autokinase [Winogradskyella psychrotolerans]